tara:strand:+ start:198 stop:1115 length:918 start_codon:yes stop_codon:yes gene_type:complete
MSQQTYDLRKIEALQTSSDILKSKDIVSITGGTAKDLIVGQTPPPQNPAEAIQLFTNGIFGNAPDPFYYRSKYGAPIYNYLIIKGDNPLAPRLDSNNFVSSATQLSSYRTKYTNSGSNQPAKNSNPNTWQTLDADLNSNTLSFPAIFMDSALISISKKKDIVKTKVVNRSSTRKEYITSGDYSVNITGVFTGTDHDVFPTADIEALIRAVEAPIPLEVISPYLFRFGITRLVVEGFDFGQERGSYASQKFSIKCTSHAASYAEIGAELINNTQNKNIIRSSIDAIANLQSTVDSQIADFFASNPL